MTSLQKTDNIIQNQFQRVISVVDDAFIEVNLTCSSMSDVTYADLNFPYSSNSEKIKDFDNLKKKEPSTPSWICHRTALALIFLCLLLLIGLGTLGTIFYRTLKIETGKLNKLKSLNEELQRNISLQLMGNRNISNENTILSNTLQNITTELCREILKNQKEHKCKPCPEKWKWHEDSCYGLSDEAQTWQNSERMCSTHNASLLKIKSESVFKFIKSLDLRKMYWVRLSPQKDISLSHKFDESIISKDWFIGNMDHLYDMMYCRYIDNVYVSYKNCNTKMNFICEKLANAVKIERTQTFQREDGSGNLSGSQVLSLQPGPTCCILELGPGWDYDDDVDFDKSKYLVTCLLEKIRRCVSTAVSYDKVKDISQGIEEDLPTFLSKLTKAFQNYTNVDLDLATRRALLIGSHNSVVADIYHPHISHFCEIQCDIHNNQVLEWRFSCLIMPEEVTYATLKFPNSSKNTSQERCNLKRTDPQEKQELELSGGVETGTAKTKNTTAVSDSEAGRGQRDPSRVWCHVAYVSLMLHLVVLAVLGTLGSMYYHKFIPCGNRTTSECPQSIMEQLKKNLTLCMEMKNNISREHTIFKSKSETKITELKNLLSKYCENSKQNWKDSGGLP
ncbi:PREDICTED: uncharacterized protein LOC102825461 [Chrysochloris asiatica]|uniref:Uncharacterized protein LOC102825461 n=1 Tax=Chrysochloris asiatica TaxID=185453 RepID=A0A9B0X0L9_CHRAS|nr:PREDICTED: uncharacterized protein LOC102825461 [Chrysochloris asiatica]